MNYSVSIDPIDTVTPFGNNPRQITPDAISKVAKSIDLYGFRSPIIVDDDRVILAGHTRLLAAQKLGLTEVPVHIASGLSKSKKRAYRLADNRAAEESRWDFPMLTEELGELMDEGFDLADTLFDASELSKLFPDAEPDESDEPEQSEVPDEAITKDGDKWILGDHVLVCGDSSSLSVLDEATGGKAPDLVYTDPPYGIDVGNQSQGKGGGVAKKIDYGVNNWDKEIPWDAVQNCFSFDSKVLIWGGNHFCHKLPPSRAWIVWDKENGDTDFADCELAWTNFDGPVRLYKFRWAGMLQGDMANKEERVHPTQKPVALAKWVFNKFKIQGLVLDLFGGSGSTLLACEQMGLAAALVEREPRYCDVIIERWQELTGQEAALESGETFNGEKSKRNLGADRAA